MRGKWGKTILFLIGILGFSLALGNIATAQTERTFTMEELAKYNGKNGNPAYVAVNGVVYDLTKVPEWANGKHFCGGAIAGKDITFFWKFIPRSHRDPNFLKRYPVAGKLVTNKPATKSSSTPNAQPSNQGNSMIQNLIIGLLIANLITTSWLLIKLKKKK